MSLTSPRTLAGLVNLPSRTLDEISIQQYDTRQRTTLGDLKVYPTPRPIPNIVFHGLLDNEDRYPGKRTIAMDVLCLRFKPGQAEQLRDCEYPPNFERLWGTTASSFNLWRKSFVLQNGCEQIL